MQVLTIEDILRAVNGETAAGPGGADGLEFTGITTDSRKAAAGTLFVPLEGERFDGHDFISSAFENGADAALTHKDISDIPDGKTVIRVRDTKKALGAIAGYYKRKYHVPSVAVTGSVGKTTTKDLIYSVLAQRYDTLKTPNNFNNDIGVPLTLFGLEKEHEMAVIEMGMNHFGEIGYLASVAEPDAAVITNIGMSHIENLGSREGIFKAKMEIASGFTDKNTLFVNGDDEFLKKVSSDTYRVVKFGMDKSNDVYAEDIVNNGLGGIEFTAVGGGRSFRAKVLQPGVHNVYNALAAVCAGLHFGLEDEEIARGLGSCVYTSSRLEIIDHNGIEIINDCYNSSPDSVRAALSVQKLSVKPRRVAVLGDVLEMGGFAEKAHYDMGVYAAELGVDMLITAGENAKMIAAGARDCGMENVVSFESSEDAAAKIKKLIKSGDSVLVKASHGMEFGKITDAIKEI